MKLLEKKTIGNMELKNSMAFPPITTGFGAVNGCFAGIETDYMVERARGGVALIFTDGVAVDRNHQLSVNAPLPYLDSDEQIAGYTRFADALRNEGAKTCIQIYHAGRQTTLAKRGGKEPIAPSAISSSLLGLIAFPDAVEMSGPQIEQAIRSFVLSASRAKCAGFDAVDIDGGAGYLIQQFMSPLTNKRTDAWGGNFEKRMRFPLEIISRVKEVVGDDYPVIFDLPMDEYVPGGITPEDGVRMASVLEEAGVHAFRVHGVMLETYNRMFPSMAVPRGINAPLGKALKTALKKAVVMLGQRINDPDLAERLLSDGACDVILLGRPLIADPWFPGKVIGGRSGEIRKCIACNTCIDQLAVNKPIRCAVNAMVGFEREYRIRKAGEVKTVLIAGGGPAGMEAARVAALKGHRVILCEKDGALGGQVRYGSVPPHKDELNSLLEYFRTQMDMLGIDVRLATPVSMRLVREIKPDVVIVATGAVPVIPAIPGSDMNHVLLACSVLASPDIVKGDRVAVIGGGSVGAETAEFLWARGKKVSVIEMLDTIAPDMGLFLSLDFQARLRETGITVLTGSKVKEIREGSLVYSDASGTDRDLKADSVVLAVGYAPERTLARGLHGADFEVVVVGDAATPRRILNAVHEGFHAARRIGEGDQG